MAEHLPQQLWPGWETVRLIGRGSYGAVYEIRRSLGGEEERAAVKHMSIPQDEQEIRELRLAGYDDGSLRLHFDELKEKILQEYGTMARLKGCGNVVYCDDIRTTPHADGFGWDINLKMELLTPLLELLGRTQSENIALRLGRDMARALAACHREKVLHRDVKPQNIFVNREGSFKLGDFGVARTMEGTGSASARTGTFRYMAPEVYNGQHYGPRADLYSLGLVMYWLLNDRRSPFVPAPPALPRSEDEERSRQRRLRGELLPPPRHGSEELKKIVLKACAFDPQDRYASAEELLRELEKLSAAQQRRENRPAPAKSAEWQSPAAKRTETQKSAEKEKDKPSAAPAKSAPAAHQTENKPAAAKAGAEKIEQRGKKAPGKKKNGLILAAALALVLLLAAGALLLRPRGPQLKALEELDQEAAALLDEGSSCVGYYRLNGRSGESVTLRIPVAADLEGTSLSLWTLAADGQQSRAELPVQNGAITAELPGGSRALLLAPTEALSEEGWGAWEDALPRGRELDEQAQAVKESRIRVRESCFSQDPNLAGWNLEGKAEAEYGPWSPWQLTEIEEAEDLETETGTVYRSREKESTTSQTPLGEDWELQNTEAEYGDWGDWSEWSESAKAQSDSCNVQTRTQYRWVKETMYVGTNGGGWRVTETGAWADDEASAMSSAPEADDAFQRIQTQTRTLYRFQERSVRYTYTYVRWSQWSEWTGETIEPAENREIETAQGWRSRERTAQSGYRYSRWGDWSDWQQSLALPDEEYETESRLRYRCRG